ncbi:MAG: hypothetical protein ACLPX5_15840, partial [Dissulfurispiraceae bacterium]
RWVTSPTCFFLCPRTAIYSREEMGYYILPRSGAKKSGSPFLGFGRSLAIVFTEHGPVRLRYSIE